MFMCFPPEYRGLFPTSAGGGPSLSKYFFVPLPQPPKDIALGEVIGDSSGLVELPLSLPWRVWLGMCSAMLIALPTSAQSPTPACPEGVEILQCARDLSGNGKRGDAIVVLEKYLETAPTNSDVQNLRAAMLSWDSRYPEARVEFRSVLSRAPGNYDAVRGLIRVELWDDHPEAALLLAEEALRNEPTSAELGILRARALDAMGRRHEAAESLRGIVSREPNNQEAADLLYGIEVGERRWAVGAGYVYDHFSDGRKDWHEFTVQGKRINDWGSLILRYNHAIRFNSQDDQAEVEAFPSLWPSAYADVAMAVAPREQLYPIVRGAIDIYQGIGWGFEVSAGYRYLQFNSGVNIVVISVGKYWGDWYFVGRAFLTPDSATGLSQSYHVAARYYFLDGDLYAGLRYGHGWSRDEVRSTTDIAVSDSNTGAAEFGLLLQDRWELSLRGSYSYGALPDGGGLGQLSTSVFAAYRF